MRKLLLFCLVFIAINSQGQIFHLYYNSTICTTPPYSLAGVAPVYLLAGINTIAPGSSSPNYYNDPTYSNNTPMTLTGNGIWEICFNPYQIFRDGGGNLVPATATIYSLFVKCADNGFSVITGTCAGSDIIITNPLSNPVSSSPSIAYGNVVSSCNVGVFSPGPTSFSVSNSPNPLKNISTFSLNAPLKSKVTLEVFNVLGKKVRTLLQTDDFNGSKNISWKGDTDHGTLLASGCYFYTLTIDDKAVKSYKLIISR